MSIASEISRLSSVREDIFTSITNKGVTVPATATFSSCPALIDSITGGGGGSPTSMINSTFTASGFISGYRPFTATQIEVPVYDYLTYTGNIPSHSNQNFTLLGYKMTTNSPQTATFSGTLQQWAHVAETQGHLMIEQTQFVIGEWSVTQLSQNEISMEFIITAYPIDSDKFFCSDLSWGWGIDTVSPYTATYMEQTGTSKPYPTYPTTTTGYITNEISGRESFTGSTYKVPNIYVSGFRNAVYDNSPEGGTNPLIPSNINLTSFSSNMLKNSIASKGYFSLDSTAYSYSYGSINSGYSGFEGI